MFRYVWMLAAMLLASPSQAVVLQLKSSNAVNSPSDVVISADGANVYAASLLGNAIEVLSRDASSGDLTPVESISDTGLVFPQRLVASADGKFVYVITQGSLRTTSPVPDSVLVYQRGVTGSLSLIGTYQNGSGSITDMLLPTDMVLSPSGDQAYIRAAGSSSLLVFSRDTTTGTLTLLQTLRDGIAGNSGLGGEGWLAVSADGGFVYTTSVSDNCVAVFSRNTTTNQLTLVKTYKNASDGIAGLSGAWGVAMSPDQQHLYVAGSVDGAIVLFTRDEVSGELTYTAAYRQGDANQSGELTRRFDGLNGPIAVSVSPDGQRVYVTGQEQGNPDKISTLAVMRRDPADGSLSFMEIQRSTATVPVTGIGGVVHIAVSPDGKDLYSAGLDDNHIGVFSHLASDVGLVVVDDVDPVNAGDIFNYMLTITNNGADDAAGVAVTDVLPADVGFVSTDSAPCVHAAGVVKCEFGILPGGAVKHINLQVTAPTTAAQLSNTAVAFSEYNDINPDDNRARQGTTVIDPNTPPVAVDDAAMILPGTYYELDAIANDHDDDDGDILTIVANSLVKLSDAGRGGTLTITDTGKLAYSPQPPVNGKNFTGTETFSYTVTDGKGGMDDGLVTIVVNTPPVAVNDSARVAQGESVTIQVLVNDSDPDGDAFGIVAVVSAPQAGGSVQIDGDGALTYTAAADYTGMDAITYTIQDTQAATAQGQVSVQVQAAINSTTNDSPPVDGNDKKGGGGSVDMVFAMLLLAFACRVAVVRVKTQRTHLLELSD